MPVTVRMMPLLARLAQSQRQEFQVDYRPGLKPVDILTAEGFTETDLVGIAVLVNGGQAEAGEPLADGDRVELVVAMQGG